MSKLLDELNKLDKDVLKYIIFSLLLDDKISYTDLSNIYVETLKEKQRKNSLLIAGMSIPLISYWGGGKLAKRKFTKVKAAYHLLKSNMFKSAEIEKELQKCVDEFNYEEDEYGAPNKCID
jgi:hypothetical protein